MTVVVTCGMALETKLDRLLWLVQERAGGNQRELARKANLAPGHIGVMVTRLKKNPDADIEGATLAKIAFACDVHPMWIVTGQPPRDLLVDRHVEFPARYASLEHVIAASPGRWSPGAVAEVRSSALDADEDPGEKHWAERLDRAETALKLARQPFPKLPSRGADPLADLDTRGSEWPPKPKKKASKR